MSVEPLNPTTDARQLRRAALAAGAFVAALWLVMLASELVGADLVNYGVFPRVLAAIPGIALAPLIHGSYTHLLTNTPPLLVLGTAALYTYPRASRVTLPMIYFGSGVAVWLFARPAYHIGASGLTHGLLFFLLIAALLRRDRPAMGIAMVVLFLYGGMVWGVLPADPAISFEYHLAGAVSGVLSAVAFHRRDPRPPRRRYSWEDEDADMDDPLMEEAVQEADRGDDPVRIDGGKGY